MKSDRLYKIIETYPVVAPAIVATLIIILGGIGVYLAEHNHPGANITNVGDAFWWAIVTITTVGYGEYFPVTLVGRLIGTLVMLSGIGTAVMIVTIISERRLRSLESRLKPKTDAHQILAGAEPKTDIKAKIDKIEKLTEEDFSNLMTGLKSLRLTLLEVNNNIFKCAKCGNAFFSKSNYCSNCGIELTKNIS